MFQVGAWKNLIELEDTLTLEELYLVREQQIIQHNEQNKFLAAIQGVDLDEEDKEESTFEQIKKRAEAALAGVSEDELDARFDVEFTDLVDVDSE